MKDVQQPGGGAVLVQLARRRLAAGIDRRFAAVQGTRLAASAIALPGKAIAVGLDDPRPR